MNDIARLILVGVNSELKNKYMDEWLNLYYETFSDLCKEIKISNPYTLEIVVKMFRYHYPSELLFTYIILLNNYARATDEATRNCILERMISSFKYIQKDYENI